MSIQKIFPTAIMYHFAADMTLTIPPFCEHEITSANYLQEAVKNNLAQGCE